MNLAVEARRPVRQADVPRDGGAARGVGGSAGRLSVAANFGRSRGGDEWTVTAPRPAGGSAPIVLSFAGWIRCRRPARVRSEMSRIFDHQASARVEVLPFVLEHPRAGRHMGRFT